MEKDYLTNLPNRRSLYQYYLNLSQNSSVHAMFVDVDNYKKVNDIYGHATGDQLLVCIAGFLQAESEGFVARIGGDEFAVLLDGAIPEEKVSLIAEKLIHKFKEIDFRREVLSVISLSIGVIENQTVCQSLDEILEKCDTAMYQAKSNGKNRYMRYNDLLSTFEVNRKVEEEMEHALKNGEFHIFLQPKINMVTSELYGAEALSRWVHPVEGVRPPRVYMNIFEKNGFIAKLDMYVFEEVCRIKASWKGTKYEHIPVSVNMSRLHLYNRRFADALEELAKKYDVNREELEIELTENTFIKDSEELLAVVISLKKKGFSVGIDDFGSGFSALYLLKDLPVDAIKIDRGFLASSSNDDRGRKILKNVITMCKDLKMEVVTKGIETEEQVKLVIGCGCQIAQGFFYAKPLPLDEFYSFAENHIGKNLGDFTFRLDGSLKSEDGSKEGIIKGHGLIFNEGIFYDSSSLYFPGGDRMENVLLLPHNVIVNDSYSVSLWIRPKTLTMWTSALFIRFENGFCSIVPQEKEETSVCRLRDATRVKGWSDIKADVLKENVWHHYMMTYDAKTETATAFINGEAVGKVENVPTNRFINMAVLGGDIYQHSFHGNICEVNFFNGVKDDDFAKELYQSYITDDRFIAFNN